MDNKKKPGDKLKEELDKKPSKKFSLDDIKETLPKLANFHGELSEYEMNLPREKKDVDLQVAIDKISNTITRLTKYYKKEKNNG